MASNGRLLISSRAKQVTYVAEGAQSKKCNLLGGEANQKKTKQTRKLEQYAFPQRKVLYSRNRGLEDGKPKAIGSAARCWVAPLLHLSLRSCFRGRTAETSQEMASSEVKARPYCRA